MKKIIVTVQNKSGQLQFDLEVPTDCAAKKLARDIGETLTGALLAGLGGPDAGEEQFSGLSSLRSKRLDRELAEDETLESAGVYNGDVLTLS